MVVGCFHVAITCMKAWQQVLQLVGRANSSLVVATMFSLDLAQFKWLGQKHL